MWKVTRKTGPGAHHSGPAALSELTAADQPLANRLYTSSAQADDAGPTAVKFAVPTVANGCGQGVGGIVIPMPPMVRR